MSLRPTPPPDESRTLLVVDTQADRLARVRATLEKVGFVTVTASSVDDTLARLDADSITAVVVSDELGIQVLERLRSKSGVRPAIVLTGATDEASVSRAYAAGADDYVSHTAPPVELVGRVRGLLRTRVDLARLARKEREAHAMLELTQALASSLDFAEILHTVVRRIAEVVNVDRASIVLVPDQDAQDVGFVVATSDDREIANLRIPLDKYPEIQQVLRTREPLTISDAATHPLLDGVRESVPDHAVGALTLLPIVWRDESMGVLFLRSAQKGLLTEREIAFCRVVANATAIALRNARVMQSLRDQTQKVNFARFEAERRLRSLKRYANLFTSAADGLCAVDPDGRLLFANPRAYELAGAGEDALSGRKLKEMIHDGDHDRLASVWSKLQDGEFPTGVDLRVKRPDGTTRVVSCAFSELADSDGAILVSFRDVTDDRQMAAELQKTKEFLESLIDASVDGIIASDMRGRILLFNKGAERIYGWRQSEVVGRMHVTELYPAGQAKEVMRMIRAPQHGGEGRLESVRFVAKDRLGNEVPMMLSAAMIFDEAGRPSATVGIFTDLRERLRVEERLAQAQQKLAVTEKQALIAELAGTAAHELNQPLTSVIGYGELLQRKLDATSAEHHAASVIVREAERMADIVRKIGKITRYETKSYVGTQKILDLDKAVDENEGGAH
ncbi:MAG: PAS domain S-box protein [Sandaracinaceae bacterium]